MRCDRWKKRLRPSSRRARRSAATSCDSAARPGVTRVTSTDRAGDRMLDPTQAPACPPIWRELADHLEQRLIRAGLSPENALDIAIGAARAAGVGVNELAKDYGLTAARIYQIVGPAGKVHVGRTRDEVSGEGGGVTQRGAIPRLGECHTGDPSCSDRFRSQRTALRLSVVA